MKLTALFAIILVIGGFILIAMQGGFWLAAGVYMMMWGENVSRAMAK